MPTSDAEGSHYVPRKWPEYRHITHSLPQHSSVLQGGSAGVCSWSRIQLTPVHSWWALTPTTDNVEPPCLIHQLHRHMELLSPVLPLHYSSPATLVWKSLHVFLRQYASHRALDPPHIGPYTVIACTDRRSNFSVHGRAIVVSANTVILAFMLNETKHGCSTALVQCTYMPWTGFLFIGIFGSTRIQIV
jgi:hypothetical protein